MTDVAAFLTARLDEDEQAAREASAFYDDDEDGVSWDGHEGKDVNGFQRYWIAPHLGVVNDVATGRHIARHDPGRVLAEVAAKRAIVRQYQNIVDAHERSKGSLGEWDWNRQRMMMRAPILELAGVYADHPDYDESWRT